MAGELSLMGPFRQPNWQPSDPTQALSSRRPSTKLPVQCIASTSIEAPNRPTDQRRGWDFRLRRTTPAVTQIGPSKQAQNAESVRRPRRRGLKPRQPPDRLTRYGDSSTRPMGTVSRCLAAVGGSESLPLGSTGLSSRRLPPCDRALHRRLSTWRPSVNRPPSVDPRLHPLVADAPSVRHVRPPAERVLLLSVQPGEQRLALCSAGRRCARRSRCPSLEPYRGASASSPRFVGFQELVQLLGVLGAQVDLVGLAADGEADRLARFGAIEVVDQRLRHFRCHSLPLLISKSIPDSYRTFGKLPRSTPPGNPGRFTRSGYQYVTNRHFGGTLTNHRNPIGIRHTVLSVSAHLS